jgi:hypothetical protein
MKANELRLGNLTYYNFHDKKEVVEICFNDFKNFERCIDRFSAIPLTEEWLLGFGFEFKEIYNGFVKNIDKDNEFIIAENVNIKQDYYLCDIDITIELKHVHQLQNLYFALTNKELIKT